MPENTEKPILRDYLAADRTILANERTLLAYIRTALALLVVGVSFIKFFDSPLIEFAGWIFIPLCVLVSIAGFRRHGKTKKMIHDVEEKNGFHDLL